MTEKTEKLLKYYKGRDNLACTIFVPSVCGNDCPFCTSKQMYKGYVRDNKYIDKIVDWIRILNKTDIVSEFVLSGGEPLFDLALTGDLILEMEKPVYINTTFPKRKGMLHQTLDLLIEDNVAGVNVSRHLGMQYPVTVVPDEIIKEIRNYVRINSLITEQMINERSEDILSFIDYWADESHMVNFRADYRNITTDNLKNRDTISSFFLENYKFEYSSNCLVCNSEFYSDEGVKVLCYHRGLEDSCVIAGYRCYVNDIVIDIYGNIHRSWDMSKTDPNFENWLIENSQNKLKKINLNNELC